MFLLIVKVSINNA